MVSPHTMSTVGTARIATAMRRRLRRGGVAVLLATIGCNLGEAEVVTRSPDLGPVVGVPSGEDARSPIAVDGGAEVGETSPPDATSFAEDLREAGNALPDTSIAPDAANVLDGARADLVMLDGSCPALADGACGFVFVDDFEDGAAGWMSTGIRWQVTDEPDASQPNAVLSPTGPAASSVYFAAGAWQDMTVTTRVRVTSFGAASSSNRVELYARYQSAGSFYAVSLRADAKLGLRANSISLGPVVSVAVAENEWHELKLKVSGPLDDVTVEGYLDGALLVLATDRDGSLPSMVGTVGVGVYGESVALFDDVTVSSP
jgi:hypothetical protein